MATQRNDRQTLRFAQDVAVLHRLGQTYEKLVPVKLRTAVAPAPVVREITALFTDLRGFTRLSERLRSDPTFLLEVLNAHMAVVVRSIASCGGTTEKFVGDGVMATFGARADVSDHAARAMAAAIGIVGANEALNRRRAAGWGFRLKVGIGVASGPVVIGAIGSPERWELGVIGDAVNIAARLASRSRGDDVLMTGTVYNEVASTLQMELTSQTVVRGRSGSLEIYRLPLLSQQVPAPKRSGRGHR
jgi:adenylate cyclase